MRDSLPAGLDAAEALLRQLLRARWTGEAIDGDAAARLPPGAFGRIVQLHGVAGLLQRRHGAQLAALPEALPAELTALRRRAALQALMQVQALRTVVSTLEAAGIATLPLKGLALSWRLYGDVGVRQSGDIDVLVDPDAAPEATALLLARGYRPTQPLPDRALHWRERMRVVHHLNLAHPDGSYLELHWRTDPLRSTSLPRLATLLPALGRIGDGPLQGLRTLPEDLLQRSLASHACRSLCARWKWGYDLLEMVGARTPGTPPWDASVLAAQDAYTGQALRLQAAQWGLMPRSPPGLRLACRAAAAQRRELIDPASGRRGALLHAGAWASLQDRRARAEYLAWITTRVSPEVGPRAYSLVARQPWLAPWVRAWAALRAGR